MKRIVLAMIVTTIMPLSALAADVVNTDAEARTLVVTENGAKSEVSIGAGETLSICSNGCFVTLPNGDREALTGSETLEIAGGRAVVR